MRGRRRETYSIQTHSYIGDVPAHLIAMIRKYIAIDTFAPTDERCSDLYLQGDD
ncbi:hypothetical protein KSZ_34380 [Dictyobacter formicarum]|uniref:Uncharacterized protein n=1 Tax=Dictyobacter formicarum TaxID=2778368 RepID=A0ABQ3VHP8_9CHLR|nr:hypothetical protein KSZ_34380 [Dictyobacter formicarum]